MNKTVPKKYVQQNKLFPVKHYRSTQTSSLTLTKVTSRRHMRSPLDPSWDFPLLRRMIPMLEPGLDVLGFLTSQQMGVEAAPAGKALCRSTQGISKCVRLVSSDPEEFYISRRSGLSSKEPGVRWADTLEEAKLQKTLNSPEASGRWHLGPGF